MKTALHKHINSIPANARTRSYRGVGGMLARLYINVQHEYMISPARMELLISEYIIREKVLAQNNDQIRKFLIRGNIRRELARPSMTFKVFIKMLKIIQVTDLDFCVELDDTQSHKISLDLRDVTIKNIQSKDDCNTPSKALASLWRRICDYNGYTLDKDGECAALDEKLSKFVELERATVAQEAAKLFSKGSVKRELQKPTMTFKVLVKGLRVLGFRKVKVLATTRKNNSKAAITCDVVLDTSSTN